MPEDNPRNIHIHIELNRRQVIAALALLLVCCGVMSLRSERLVFTTSYPSPAGIYQTLTTTDQTTLARDAGNVIVSPNATGSLNVGLNDPAQMVGPLNVRSPGGQGNINVSGPGEIVGGQRQTHSALYLHDNTPDGNSNWVIAHKAGPAGPFVGALHFVRWVTQAPPVAQIFMNIQPNGSVGINNGNPQERLDVWGRAIVHNLNVRETGLWLTDPWSTAVCPGYGELVWHHAGCNGPAAAFTGSCVAACHRHCWGHIHGPISAVRFGGGTVVEANLASICCLCAH